MHVTRFAAVVLLGLPLGGCFGVALAPQPVPDWALSPQAQYEEPAAAPRKHRAVYRAPPQQEMSSSSTLITGEVSATPQAASRPSARGDNTNANVRETMTICRGC